MRDWRSEKERRKEALRRELDAAIAAYDRENFRDLIAKARQYMKKAEWKGYYRRMMEVYHD